MGFFRGVAKWFIILVVIAVIDMFFVRSGDVDTKTPPKAGENKEMTTKAPAPATPAAPTAQTPAKTK